MEGEERVDRFGNRFAACGRPMTRDVAIDLPLHAPRPRHPPSVQFIAGVIARWLNSRRICVARDDESVARGILSAVDLAKWRDCVQGRTRLINRNQPDYALVNASLEF